MKKATRERQSTPREWQNVDQHRAILCLRFCGANRYFFAGDAASFSVCSPAVNCHPGRLPALRFGPGSRAAHRARLCLSRPASGGLPSLTLPLASQRCTPVVALLPGAQSDERQQRPRQGQTRASAAHCHVSGLSCHGPCHAARGCRHPPRQRATRTVTSAASRPPRKPAAHSPSAASASPHNPRT